MAIKLSKTKGEKILIIVRDLPTVRAKGGEGDEEEEMTMKKKL